MPSLLVSLAIRHSSSDKDHHRYAPDSMVSINKKLQWTIVWSGRKKNTCRKLVFCKTRKKEKQNAKKHFLSWQTNKEKKLVFLCIMNFYFCLKMSTFIWQIVTVFSLHFVIDYHNALICGMVKLCNGWVCVSKTLTSLFSALCLWVDKVDADPLFLTSQV